jgi:hypothetical protein
MPRKVKTKKADRSTAVHVRRAAHSLARTTKRAARAAKRAVTPKANRRVRHLTSIGADAVKFLKGEHRQLLTWLVELKATPSVARRDRLLRQVEQGLKTHTKLEEELFYPAFRDVAATSRDLRLYYEAREEHHAVDTVLPEVSGASRSRPEVFAARVKVLTEMVERHADEEETDMFPRARALIPAAELRRLGEEMAARRRTLQQNGSGPLSVVAALFSS